jgi:hypothetical protein
MKRIICILMISGSVLIGCCKNFTGVRPIYPEIGWKNISPSPIESLQPTFRWEPSTGADSYDLVVYKAINKYSIWKGARWAIGEEIYYREGLRTYP